MVWCMIMSAGFAISAPAACGSSATPKSGSTRTISASSGSSAFMPPRGMGCSTARGWPPASRPAPGSANCRASECGWNWSSCWWRRMRRHQQLDQFHPHSLARQLAEPGAGRDAGGQPRAVEQPMPLGGMKAEEPEDAEIVLVDPLFGVADEPHAAGADIAKPADIIMHHTIGAHREC